MICISGPIGAGKTTLTRLLAGQLGTKSFEEPVGQNPILKLFYHGNEIAAKKRQAGDSNATNPYTFLLQIYYLNKRFAMIKKAQQEDNNVLDRSIYEDNIFMKMNTELGNATKTEYEVYHNLLNNMLQELPYATHKKSPDLMIYIKLDYPTMIKHIQKRDRPYEQINQDPSLVHYYKKLLQEYNEWTSKEYKASPLITVDASKIDFVNNINDTKTTLDQIYRELLKLNTIDDPKFTRLENNLDNITSDDISMTR